MYRIYQSVDGVLTPVLLVDQKIDITKQKQTIPFIVFSKSEAEETVSGMNKKSGSTHHYVYKKVSINDED